MASSSSEDDVGAHDSDDADMHLDPTVESPTVSMLIHLCTDFRRPHSLTIIFSSEHVVTDERRRSPSVPWSASPPPDSDHDDFDLDFDSDIDWDSSSLSVPSPAPALRIKVETTDDLQPFKQELADIRDMLDAWEDFDCAPTSTVSSATIKLPTTDDLKFDALEFWEWEFEGGTFSCGLEASSLNSTSFFPPRSFFHWSHNNAWQVPCTLPTATTSLNSETCCSPKMQ